MLKSSFSLVRVLPEKGMVPATQKSGYKEKREVG